MPERTPSRYDILQHGAMVGDRRRLGPYLEAIRRVVRPGAVVVDIGTGSGIFALAACQAGAGRVFAIEPDVAVQVARDVVAANGFADRVELIEALSTQVVLPEPADVVVLDVRGVLPDDQVRVAHDAHRFLKPAGRIIPASDSVWVSPVAAPELFDDFVGGWNHDEDGVDLRPIRGFAVDRWYKCHVGPGHLVGEARRLAEIDYRLLESADIQGSADWTIVEPTIAHGFVAWFESVLCEEVHLSNRPGAPELLYGQGFFPWPQPVSLSPGQVVRIQLALDGASSMWSWTTSVSNGGALHEPMLRFAHPAEASSPRDVDKTESTSGPLIDEELVEIDRLILDFMADGASVGAIAQHVAGRYSARFPRLADALTHVGSLSYLYG
jgi:protein arginine N-methyltransferase 1